MTEENFHETLELLELAVHHIEPVVHRLKLIVNASVVDLEEPLHAWM